MRLYRVFIFALTRFLAFGGCYVSGGSGDGGGDGDVDFRGGRGRGLVLVDVACRGDVEGGAQTWDHAG